MATTNPAPTQFFSNSFQKKLNRFREKEHTTFRDTGKVGGLRILNMETKKLPLSKIKNKIGYLKARIRDTKGDDKEGYKRQLRLFTAGFLPRGRFYTEKELQEVLTAEFGFLPFQEELSNSVRKASGR